MTRYLNNEGNAPVMNRILESIIDAVNPHNLTIDGNKTDHETWSRQIWYLIGDGYEVMFIRNDKKGVMLYITEVQFPYDLTDEQLLSAVTASSLTWKFGATP